MRQSRGGDLPQGLALLAERFHRLAALLLALLGHCGSGAARWLRRLRSLSRSSWACFSISFQSCMSTSPAGNLPATPSANSRSSTGALRVSSSCRRLTSSKEAPRFSASASTTALSRGLSCSRRSRIWVAILNFLMSKNRLRHRKKLQRALARRWLHTHIRDLKTQAAHAAHQPQAARSQPNARRSGPALRGGPQTCRQRSRSARGQAAWPSASVSRVVKCQQRAPASSFTAQRTLTHSLRSAREEDDGGPHCPRSRESTAA